VRVAVAGLFAVVRIVIAAVTISRRQFFLSLRDGVFAAGCAVLVTLFYQDIGERLYPFTVVAFWITLTCTFASSGFFCVAAFFDALARWDELVWDGVLKDAHA